MINNNKKVVHIKSDKDIIKILSSPLEDERIARKAERAEIAHMSLMASEIKASKLLRELVEEDRKIIEAWKELFICGGRKAKDEKGRWIKFE